MSQTITAIYADGVLRPLVPLTLPEQTQVELVVRPASDLAACNEERQQFIEALAQAGLLANAPALSPFPTNHFRKRNKRNWGASWPARNRSQKLSLRSVRKAGNNESNNYCNLY